MSSDRRTSGIWKHYFEYLDKWGKKRAKCNYCTSNFASESTNGTSTLWRHLNEVCPNSPLRIIDRNKSRIKVVKKGEQAYSTCTVEKVVININKIRRAIAEFVIIEEQPFKVVEGEGFRRLMAVSLPNFQLPSRLTVARQYHKGETIAKGIEACLFDWEIENIFTVTLDNATANDSAIKHLKRRIEDLKGDILGNEFLHVDSTYMMLDTTVKFEKSFSRMYDDDHKYLKYCLETNNVGGHPSIDDWKNVEVFIKFLEIFYHVTLKFSGTSYVTSNSFFHDIFNLQMIICKNVRSEDSILSGMAKKMELKFNKYWGTFESMNKLLFIAVILDPRYKLKYVEYLFKNSYGCLVGAEKSKKVMDTLSRLYDYYMSSFCGTYTDKIGGQTSLNDEIDTMYSDEIWQSQWEKYLANEDNTENKSELEKYLVDDLEKTKELDILAWKKVSSARYPIISRMARDVLSIPISTVASELAFSTGGRILYSYQSSLSPKTVEALI
ncbi:zinc finger BED domain-containing protein RICESLEEPER 1-like [Lycium barbarum]|uniref:zinc finger BED domain-containing protein RICESLEEPER 1-like n=1 Tax=Lycium barbarum TaxID=112863 RepID=UPI00293E7F5B|nr:zinc finger BED domain-containing protein RICESLEEPER 1-like [Lycium barbarum]